jgi:hypothetical protein
VIASGVEARHDRWHSLRPFPRGSQNFALKGRLWVEGV